jgi:hypothetical protein
MLLRESYEAGEVGYAKQRICHRLHKDCPVFGAKLRLPGKWIVAVDEVELENQTRHVLGHQRCASRRTARVGLRGAAGR